MSKDPAEKAKAVTKPDDSFNPDDKISQVHDAVFRPDQFANLFCDAARSQVKVKDTLKEVIREMIETDVKSRTEIKELIRVVEKEDILARLKKAGFFIWSACLAIGGTLVGYFLRGTP